MSERTFDRETLLDLTVNVIPLGIILFFVVVFLLIKPWEQDPLIQIISMGLLVIPFVGLALLTFVSGRAIAQAEGESTTATSELTASDAELEAEATSDTDDYTMTEDRLENTESDTADETEADETDSEQSDADETNN
jgi:cytoskeletal protein RodZ